MSRAHFVRESAEWFVVAAHIPSRWLCQNLIVATEYQIYSLRALKRQSAHHLVLSFVCRAWRVARKAGLIGTATWRAWAAPAATCCGSRRRPSWTTRPCRCCCWSPPQRTLGLAPTSLSVSLRTAPPSAHLTPAPPKRPHVLVDDISNAKALRWTALRELGPWKPVCCPPFLLAHVKSSRHFVATLVLLRHAAVVHSTLCSNRSQRLASPNRPAKKAYT